MFYSCLPDFQAQSWRSDNENTPAAAFAKYRAAYCSHFAMAPPVIPNNASQWISSFAGHGISTVSAVPTNYISPWMHNAWMEAKQSYYNYCYYWYMCQNLRLEQKQENYGDSVSPSTVAAFCDVALDTTVPLTDSTLKPETDSYGKCALTQKTEVQSPSVHLLTDEDNEEAKVAEYEHLSASALFSFCMLCGEDSHRYTACRLFDGKTLCFIYFADSTIYAMRHDRWIESATLRDVYSFVHLAVGLEPHRVLLRLGNQSLRVEDYPLATRCCDLQILPGVVVGLSKRQHFPRPNMTPLESYNKSFKTNNEEERKGDVSEGEGIMDDETLDVSAIAKAPELSVSLPLLERYAKLKVDVEVMTKDIVEDAPNSDQREKSLLSDGDGTAAPSPPTPGASNDSLCDINSTGRTDTGSDVAYLPQGSSSNVSVSIDSSTRGIMSLNSSRTGGAEHVSVNDEGKEQQRGVAHVEVLTVLRDVDSEAGKGSLDVLPTLRELPSQSVGDEELRRHRTVHVRFIPVSMSFLAIRKLLWSCGEVWKVRLVRPKAATNPERMFYVCFVEYATVEGAEMMMKLQGHRVTESFRLAVESCRHPIRGGYVTDRDVDTGKPCTFGLGDEERHAVESRFTGGENAGRVHHNTDGVWKDSARWSRRRGGQRQRGHGRSGAPSAREEKEDQTMQVKDGEMGPYTLQIVATADSRKGMRGGFSCYAASGAGSDNEVLKTNASQTSPATAPAMMLLPNSVKCQTVMDGEKAMRDRLSRATASYVHHASPKNFFEALTVLEDIKWNPVTAMFSLTLTRCEVALFLQHVQPQDAENATVAATKAIHWGNDYIRLLSTVTAVGARIPSVWQSLFTSTPLTQQRYEVLCGEKEGVETPCEDSTSRLYPSCCKMVRFVELLLHIALLLDDFQREDCQKHNDLDVDTVAQSDIVSPETGRLSSIVCELLACSRRLLRQLQIELSVAKGSSTSELFIWRRKVTHVLQLLPTEVDWCVGRLMNVFLPDTRQFAVATLMSQIELSLF